MYQSPVTRRMASVRGLHGTSRGARSSASCRPLCRTLIVAVTWLSPCLRSGTMRLSRTMTGAPPEEPLMTCGPEGAAFLRNDPCGKQHCWIGMRMRMCIWVLQA